MNNGDRGATGLGEGERRIIVLFRFELIIAVTRVTVGVVLICSLFRVATSVTNGGSLGLCRQCGERGDEALELSLGLDLRLVRPALTVGEGL